MIQIQFIPRIYILYIIHDTDTVHTRIYILYIIHDTDTVHTRIYILYIILKTTETGIVRFNKTYVKHRNSFLQEESMLQ